MPSSRASASLSFLAASLTVALPACAQSVISARAGVIHFFEGNVYLRDQLLEPHLGIYPTIAKGAELRTADGRAEVLLTPGVFLRIGANTTICMISNDLADTQVELRTGSAIIVSGEPNPNTSVTILYKDWRAHLLGKGVYRIDTDPPHLAVREGQAEVSAAGGQPVSVVQGMNLPFASVLVPERSNELDAPGQKDMLNDWSNGRNDSITADDAITAQLDQDPSTRTADADGFTYFPMLGVPPVGLGSVGSTLVPYSSYPAQLGFNSIYLPGYTYRPMILGLMGPGLIGPRPGVYLPPGSRIGGFVPGTGIYIPGRPGIIVRPTPLHIAPAERMLPSEFTEQCTSVALIGNRFLGQARKTCWRFVTPIYCVGA